MFIAHVPAGYLLGRFGIPAAFRENRPVWSTLLFFSAAPDLDLIWFYTVGARRVAHHAYISHWPLFWTALAASALLVSALMATGGRKPRWRPLVAAAYAGVMLHLALDSLAAEIYWLAPFSSWSLNLVHVPARYGWWVWNFILHWTFFAELAICFAALYLWRGGRKKKRASLAA